jgi:hypothetical protein
MIVMGLYVFCAIWGQVAFGMTEENGKKLVNVKLRIAKQNIYYQVVFKRNDETGDDIASLLETDETPVSSSALWWLDWKSIEKAKVSELLNISNLKNKKYPELIAIGHNDRIAIRMRSTGSLNESVYFISLSENRIISSKDLGFEIIDLCWVNSDSIFLLLSEEKVDYSGLGVLKAIAGHPEPISKFSFAILDLENLDHLQIHSITKEYERNALGYAECRE